MSDPAVPQVPGEGPIQFTRHDGRLYAGRDGCLWVLVDGEWTLATDVPMPPSSDFRYHERREEPT